MKIHAKNTKTIMNLKYGYLFVLLLGFSLSSCDLCDDTDCPPKVISMDFSPVDFNGAELLEMSDSIYNKDSIMILPENAVMRIIYSSSSFKVLINPSITEFTINWSRNKVDTFKMETFREELDCCGEIPRLRSLSNQDSVIKNISGTIKVVVP